MQVKTTEEAQAFTSGYLQGFEEICNLFDKLLTHGHPPQRVINILYDVLYQKADTARRNAELWR